MNHDEIADLLGAYALDAVDDTERAAIDTHLAVCPRCRAEVQEHREAAALLAHTGGDAPAGVWQRIAGALEEPPPKLRLAPVDAPRAKRRARPSARYVLAGAAGAAIAIIAVLGVHVRQQDQRIDDLQATLDEPLAPAFAEALEDPDSQIIELASADGETVLRGAVTDDGRAYLQADPLPAAGPERTYQLWGAAGDRLISLGVLGSQPGIVAFKAGGYDAFAITEEVAPGVVTSTQTPVVAGGTT